VDRRDFIRLAALGAAGAGLQYTGAEASTSVLSPGDLQYRGLFLLPNDPGTTKFGWSYGALTGRRVNGNLHLFIAGQAGEASGDGAGLADNPYEIDYPGTGFDIRSAPRASLVRDWGATYQSRLLTSQGGTTEVRGLVYRDGYLWASYGYMYNTYGWHDPSIVAVKLNDNGSVNAYGPWRTQEHSQRTRGYFVPIPDSFSSAYAGGRRIAVGAPLTSGAANCPVGSSLVALPAIDPVATPADRPGVDHISLDCKRLVYHDADHPQERSGNYKICGWKVPYDCGQGSYVIDGPPNFGNEFWVRRDSGTIRDKITASAWVKTATKEGIVFFGEITDVIPGMNYASDGMPHMWYGPEKPCCHGHVATGGQGTGPRSPSQVPMVFTYDPADFARAAQGAVAPWGFPARGSARLNTLAPTIPAIVGTYTFGGAWFDEVAQLLFVSQINADSITNGYSPRPVIHVFEVGSGAAPPSPPSNLQIVK
jgi:hypothetical protein